MMLTSPSLRLAAVPPATTSRHVRARGKRPSRRVVVMASEGSEVSAVYASALVTLAQSENKLEKIQADIDILSTIIKSDNSLPQFIANPLIDEKQKRKLLNDICQQGQFDEAIQNFLELIMDRERVDMLEEICDVFEEEYCRLTDTQVATLTSANELTDNEQFEVAKQIQGMTGAKNIKLKPILDESLLGGFIVQYGSNIVDVSLRGRLENMASAIVVEITEDV